MELSIAVAGSQWKQAHGNKERKAIPLASFQCHSCDFSHWLEQKEGRTGLFLLLKLDSKLPICFAFHLCI